MKKLKLNASRLQLSKDKIANLSMDAMDAIQGGISSDGSSGRVNPNIPMPVPTRGNCDIPTYSWDDGSWCISASRVGCTCGGI